MYYNIQTPRKVKPNPIAEMESPLKRKTIVPLTKKKTVYFISILTYGT